MHTLSRNKRKFWYALYTGKTATVDANGDATGEYEITYGTPVQINAYVSPKRGSTINAAYGVEHNYDRKIITDNMNCPIDEQTAIWIDTEPTRTVTIQGQTVVQHIPHDYIVKSVSKGFNEIVITVNAAYIEGVTVES